MPGVQELFAELFAYVLCFEQATLEGENQPSYQHVRSTIGALLEKGKTTARQQGIPDTDFQDACFAAVAWADETILRCTTWKYHHDWNAFPLQQEYFQTRRAGEELFTRLKNLSNDQKDTRETYYLCLGLGFNGQYFRETDEPLLSQIRHEQARRLARPVESVYSIEKITPQPYTVPTRPGKPVTDLWTQWLVKTGYALVIGVPVVLLMLWGYLAWRAPAQLQVMVTKGGNGSGTVKSVPEGVDCGPVCSRTYTSGTVLTLQPTPARGSVWSGWGGDPACKEGALTVSSKLTCTAIFTLDAQAIQAAALADQQCARVSTALDGRVVELKGVVKSEAQGASIRKNVESIEGVERVKGALRLIPSYFCDIFALLDPIKKAGEDQSLGLIASLSNPGEIPVYRSGEYLVVTGTVPTRFASFVYIDYYNLDSQVWHLIPNAQEKDNRRDRGQRFIVGNQDSPNPWIIGGDQFGIELVTVLVSKIPLFLRPRGEEEPAMTYLKELRQSLFRVAPAGEVAAMLLLMETSAAQ
jgi:type VI secretion system protein ImpK